VALRTLNRKIRMDLMKCDGDICELLFANRKAQHACRLFLNHLKCKGGLTKHELSLFAFDLDAGKVEAGFQYRRTSFYQQIRRTLLTLGLIAIEQRFVGRNEIRLEPERSRKRDIINKYVAVRQPIPRRPPDGLNLPRLTWVICHKWNEEFSQ
jgi:hypothetical protein